MFRKVLYRSKLREALGKHQFARDGSTWAHVTKFLAYSENNFPWNLHATPYTHIASIVPVDVERTLQRPLARAGGMAGRPCDTAGAPRSSDVYAKAEAIFIVADFGNANSPIGWPWKASERGV